MMKEISRKEKGGWRKGRIREDIRKGKGKGKRRK